MGEFILFILIASAFFIYYRSLEPKYEEPVDEFYKRLKETDEYVNRYFNYRPKKQTLEPGSEEWYNKRASYMRSLQWKEKRLKRLEIDNYSCVVCGAQHRLELHHLTYDNLFDEELDDLRTLCRDHHQLQHDTYGYYTKGYHPLIIPKTYKELNERN